MRSRRLALVAVLGLAACNNTPAVRPSPLPPGYATAAAAAPAPPAGHEERGESLDKLLAVVEGEGINRRRLIRETGGRVEGMTDAVFERQLQRQLKEWARTRLFVKEAHRVGLRIQPSVLDRVVEENGKRMEKEASKEEGQPVALDDILRSRGLTRREFRQMVHDQSLYRLYLARITQGVAGARPMIEMEVSPAEIKAIHRQYPGAFDDPPGVRFAVYYSRAERFLGPDGADFAGAEARAAEQARVLAAAARQGRTPDQIAKRFDLQRGTGEWFVVTDFLEADSELARTVIVQEFGEEGRAWLFGPERRPGDVTTIDRVQNPAVLHIIEVRAPKQRNWEEAREEIVKRVQLARTVRAEQHELIRMLTSRRVVWPEGLANALMDDAQEKLARLDEDPILGAARFR